MAFATRSRARSHVRSYSMLLAALLAALLLITGCTSATNDQGSDSSAGGEAGALPDSAYRLDPTLPTYIDPDTGYDTTRDWALEDTTWPVCLIMSPSQSPQLLLGEEKSGPTGQKSGSARGAFVVVDAFRVYSSRPRLYVPECASCHAERTATHW